MTHCPSCNHLNPQNRTSGSKVAAPQFGQQVGEMRGPRQDSHCIAFSGFKWLQLGQWVMVASLLPSPICPHLLRDPSSKGTPLEAE